MSNATIAAVPEDLVRGITQLEPLPATAQLLFDSMNGKDVAMSKIIELIQFDQAVAAAVLRQASTVRYATQVQPTVREAVLRLGTVGLFNLVLEGYLTRLRVAAPMYDLSEHDLWLHGAAAQLAVRALRIERPGAGIPELAETAALMHDIGKLIVARYLKADVRDLVTYARERSMTFVEVEHEFFGTDHAAVGGAIAEHWKFPPSIVDAIRRHHSPSFGTSTLMLDTVVMANVVAKTIQAGLGAEGLNFVIDPGNFRRLGLNFNRFCRVCLRTEEWLRELMSGTRMAT